MTPSTSAALLEARGFHVKNSAAKELLETIGQTFLSGYAAAAESGAVAETEERLEEIPRRFRGFAYEGAAMCYAILDALPFGGNRVAGFLAGRADAHVYMAYVGVGWAMARLPRFRWRTLAASDPLLRWLILDGYGFHQAYFHTDRYVRQQFQDRRFPWPADGPRQYAARAVDQGIGRAMWFVGGADPEVVATLLDRFPEARRPDLYSGAGLAAAYAGGADEAELRQFWRHAGEHRPQVAQGCVFAATARLRADLMMPHTELAAEVFCGMTPRQVAAISDRARLSAMPRGGSPRDGASRGSSPRDSGPRDDVPHGDVPAYEIWRQRIANTFVPVER